MTDAKQAKRGRPSKPGKVAFNFRMSADLRERLVESAVQLGLSLTEEAERRLRRDFGWEASKQDIDEIKQDTIKWRDAEHLNALRLVGLQILRETEGRPVRLIVDLRSFLSEADATARGLRSGFVDKKVPPSTTPGPRTEQEDDQLEVQIADSRRLLEAAKARLDAEDAAADEQERTAAAETVRRATKKTTARKRTR